MIKINYLSVIIPAVCLLVSCSNEQVPRTNVEDDGWHTATMLINASKDGFDGATKAIESWKDGDVLYLLFSKESGKVQGKAVYSASESSWTVNYQGSLRGTSEAAVSLWYFDGAGTENSGTLSLTSSTEIYVDESGKYTYPSDGDLVVTGSLKPKTGRIQFKGEAALSIEVGGISHCTSFNMSTGALSVSDGSATLQVQTDGYTPYLYGTFTDAENRTLSIAHGDAVFTVNCSVNVLQTCKSGWMNIPTVDSHNEWTMQVAVKSITLDQTSLTLEKGGSATLTAAVLPATATDKTVKWSTSDAAVASVDDGGTVKYVAAGTAVITASSVQNSSVKATCTVTCKADKFNGHAYVDLGLTSGTLWATMNVGAEKPEDYGDYFAWGEIIDYNSLTTNFNWSTYKWCNGSGSLLTKYCTNSDYGIVDNKTELDEADDVAHIKWGGIWRMPSMGQIDELINECSSLWTMNNGVYGRMVTSLKNGNSIFLPGGATEGASGSYWSRSLCVDINTNAEHLIAGSVSLFRSYLLYRYAYIYVRPVAQQ